MKVFKYPYTDNPICRDKTMQKIGTFLNNQEYEILKEICEKEGKTIYKKTREIIQEYLNKYEKQKVSEGRRK